jgi:hypothetical protein
MDKMSSKPARSRQLSPPFCMLKNKEASVANMPHREKSRASAEHLPLGRGQLLLPFAESDAMDQGRIALGDGARAGSVPKAVTSMAHFGQPEGIMRHQLSNGCRRVRLAGLVALATLAGLVMGFGLSSSSAQDAPKPQQIVRPASTNTPVVTSGSGQYYVEFRSRYAWDYGHTYLVHGRVGEAPTKDSVAGLSPVGDDATAWVNGHYVPVPAETGWTDGDLEDKYVSSRYRVLMNKDQYDRIVAYIKQQQAGPHVWSAELNNCNAFVADIAEHMGLKVPSSSLIYPKIFVNHLRLLNTGHPEAADTLVSDNVKEMSNPTRDGRAMINNHIYKIGPDGTPTSVVVAAKPATPAPKVTIGSVRVSNKTQNSASDPSQ